MVTYIILWSFTEQGLKNIKHTTDRADFFKAQAQEQGIRVKEYYWTMGQYDGVIVVEAPDDEKIARLLLMTCSLGTVRVQPLRAFSHEEMGRILA